LKLIIQPGDGVEKLVKGIKKAKRSVEIMIFRFDYGEIEKALIEAAERGVFVHALIAFTNRGGEGQLRKLEMRLLEKGITVARTAGDLVRYHGKMMLIDRREVYVLAFNFTHLDIDHSRSFGLVTRQPKFVQEAARLFDADTKRQSYSAGHSKFLVSPVNARKELAAFLKGAKKELLIYDPNVSDRAMLRILDTRYKVGVKIRVVGSVAKNRLSARNLSRMRLHTRVILRDGQQAFLGSQSLRQLELDARREIGVILRNRSVVSTLARTFEEDWAASEPDQEQALRRTEIGRAAKKLSKEVSKSLRVDHVVKGVVQAVRKQKKIALRPKEIESAVKRAVKDTVRDVAEKRVARAMKEMGHAAEATE
jgi:phosphatidylserine/phosphatidylglycerophosphate/cardiolipin synthase-like enzyme